MPTRGKRRRERSCRRDCRSGPGLRVRLLKEVVLARLTLVVVLILLCALPAGAGGAGRNGAEPRLTSGGIPVYGFTLIDSFPHDPNAYTQGLVYETGFLYEGTGLYGGSSLRKVVLETGEVVKRRNLASAYFGEGVTVRCDTVYQLTWQNNTGFVYEELEEFELIETFSYPTQGWGLTHDDTSLIMSDGSDKIYYLDPHTYEEVGRVYVTAQGSPVYDLNELELIRGRIYANIWYSDSIAVIEPGTGAVVAWLDLSSIYPYPRPGVLNGIAFDPDSVSLFVTGKNWPTLFEIWVDPLDFAPEIMAYSPPAHVCAFVDSPMVLSVSAEDRDPADSLQYAWSVNGVVEPLARDTSYTYTGSTSTVDTVVASVTDGIFSDSATWVIYVEIAGVDGRGGRGDRDVVAPDSYSIQPNPVRGAATITFTVGGGSESSRPVRLTLHDVSGRMVACLLDSDLPRGDYTVAWDGRDDLGKRVSPGIFFCVLRSEGTMLSSKIAVLE
jgi:glutamine cyclotransferase